MVVAVNDDMLTRILSSQEYVSRRVLHRSSQAEAVKTELKGVGDVGPREK